MTNGELQHFLDDENKKISMKEFRNILYELIDDCTREATKDNLSFYNGEIKAFYIALDLSEHIKEEFENAE